VKKKFLFFKLLFLGIIYALPYVFPALFILSWVMLVPLVYFVTEHICELTKRRAYLMGLAFGLGYYLVMYHWFINFYPMEFAGVTKQMAAALVIVCWFGLALVQALEMGAVTLLYRIIRPSKDNPLICGALFSALWVLFEWQQNFFWRGVPWARLSITQTAFPQLIQSASLFGNLFVSGMIVFVNVLIYLAVKTALPYLAKKDIKQFTSALKNKRTAVFALAAVGIFTVNLGFGCIRCAVFNDKSDRAVKAAVIQGNMSSLDKWSGANSIGLYMDLTEQCVNETGAKLVVWPETVIPWELTSYKGKVNDLCELAEELEITMLVGSFEAVFSENGERSEYNTIYMFLPDGTLSEQRYYKQKLVPFGEYNPAGPIMDLIPALDVLGVFNDPLTPGEGSQLLESEHGTLGALICFDSIYESLARQSVIDGAEIITLSTNDSWFSDSAAVWQHNRHATVRAIESGRYVVRAASTGVSSFISPTGKVLDTVAPLTEGYSVMDVYMLTERTAYSYIGNLFVYLCLGFTVGVFSYNFALRVRSKIQK
jgi:apolipoprotein N-acyltransferase